MNFLAFLGHGRALELYLGCLTLLIGATIVITELSRDSPALADIAWYYSRVVVAAPFFVIGALQLIGWFLNINGIHCNWIFRAAGASLAVFVWAALLIKSGLVGEGTFVIPLTIVNLPASAFLLWRAWNKFPIPGTVGAK